MLTGLLTVVIAISGTPASAWSAPIPTPADSATAEPTTPAADAAKQATPSPSDTASPEPSNTEPSKSEPAKSQQPDPSESADATAEPSSTPDSASAEPSTLGPKAGRVGVAPQALPPDPGLNGTIVNVRVGGNRTGVAGVTPVRDAVLGLYANETGGTEIAWCTSDADGDCNFTVLDTGPGGANRVRFWVRQISAPDNWLLNGTLRTGNADGNGSQSTPYRFRTPQLIGGQTISSQTTQGFMLQSGNNTRNASGGIWQLSRVNPTLPTSCGLDVALILDLSGSVSGQETALRGAANTLVDALQGTPSRMSLFSFSSGSPALSASQNYPALTSVSTAAQGTAFKTRYATWGANGGTNWDVGLAAVANAPAVPDIAIVITDGNPSF